MPSASRAASLSAPTAAAPSEDSFPRPREFAGISYRTLALTAAMLVLLVWNAWASRELFALKRHRMVSVSLSTLISDFVIAESRSGGSAEETSARTKLYIAATQAAMKSLAADGTTILVSEAVMSNSVPDYTPVVKAAVDKALKGPSGAQR